MKNSAILIWLFTAFLSCKKQETTATSAETPKTIKTPVDIAYPVDTASISDDILLNATSSYLLKSDIKANTTGYITHVNAKLADRVGRGQVLFGIQTKEARALGNTINKLDKSFRFSGSTQVTSPSTGYIDMLNHQTGDYVLDGDVLASVTDLSSFGFVMNVPYEYNQMVPVGRKLNINLPDGRILSGTVAKVMPSVDAAAQTEKILVKVQDGIRIPENLIAKISLTKHKTTGIAVPKSAVLSDETQSSFWVMKLINDTTAVKFPIDKGIENDKWVEVKNGNISLKDRIVTSGNFGLSDTAYVKVNR